MGPRGRGLGRPTESRFQCARCGREAPLEGALALDAVCSHCGSDLHTCTNCRHFDSAAPRQCRLDIPAPIPRKAARNECDLFEPRSVQVFGSEGGVSDGRKAFDSLFDF